MTDEQKIAALQDQVDVLYGLVFGLQSVVAGLIAKHHDHPQLVLHLATLTEWLLAGRASDHMSERQKQAARELLENMQMIQPVIGAIDPLSDLRNRPPGDH